eukprot:jgi/Orpsp1_1/1178704/evm.model.c7180000066423.1
MDDILLLYSYDNRDDRFSIIYKIYEYIQNNNSSNHFNISPMMAFHYLLHENIQDEKIREMNDIFNNLDWSKKKRYEIISITCGEEDNGEYYSDEDSYNHYYNSGFQNEEIKQDITAFKDYINRNNIELKDLNMYNFDILIYVIKHNFSKEIIEYIIDQINYKSLDYTIKNISPLFTAISCKRFDIADMLIDRGADINYKIDINYKNKNRYSNDNKINIFLNEEGIKYLLKNGYKDKSFIVIGYINFKLENHDHINNYSKIYKKIFVKDIKDISAIINDFIYNKELITALLDLYKNKKPLSKKQFRKIFSNFVSQVINDE